MRIWYLDLVATERAAGAIREWREVASTWGCLENPDLSRALILTQKHEARRSEWYQTIYWITQRRQLTQTTKVTRRETKKETKKERKKERDREDGVAVTSEELVVRVLFLHRLVGEEFRLG